MDGFYFHSRKLYEMYSDNMKYLFVCQVLLYHARFLPVEVNGIEVREGQMLFKLDELAHICNMSISQVRSILRKFSEDGGVRTENKGKHGILITLLPPFICTDTNGKRCNGQKRSTYKNKSEKQSNASYDIERAEERARQSVPKLKKRER